MNPNNREIERDMIGRATVSLKIDLRIWYRYMNITKSAVSYHLYYTKVGSVLNIDVI